MSGSLSDLSDLQDLQLEWCEEAWEQIFPSSTASSSSPVKEQVAAAGRDAMIEARGCCAAQRELDWQASR